MNFNTLTYCYTFLFDDKRQLSFSVSVDPSSKQILTKDMEPPEWCRLAHHQCSVCRLSAKSHPFCPVAVSISELVTAFKDIVSFTPCTVSCYSEQRTVTKDTVAQVGLASILGLLMATSDCPQMNFLRPLARFHLPFASLEESIFRLTAAHLLKQYFNREQGNNNNSQNQFSLEDIKASYAMVQKVNKGILGRIRGITDRDADSNSIITLSTLAQILEIELDSNLESLRQLFLDQ